MRIHDKRICELGEGPLWHPKRNELFWFDIIGQRLLGENGQEWSFDEPVSAAGWVDNTTLLIASASALLTFDLDNGAREPVAKLEADNPITRSNDGRADPFGGFWIGTMGRNAETQAGAIYRYYLGELRKLYDGITISNAISFAPDGRTAYFCDTRDGRVMRQRLADKDGWPQGEPETFLDLRGEGFGADGAVIDAEGNFWNAQWGASRVACYSPAGVFLRAIEVPARHTSCPAFGGPDLTTLFCTSALEGISGETRANEPDNGRTFAERDVTLGQAEHQVIL